MTGRKATRLRQGSGEGNEGAYSMTYAEIVKNSLGGIMFWEITQDTTEPELSLLGRIHSLLKAQ